MIISGDCLYLMGSLPIHVYVDDPNNPAFLPHVYTESNDQSHLLNTTQLTTELILGQSALTSCASVHLVLSWSLPKGHYA